MDEIVYLNDQLAPADQARVSAYDAGFLQGVGLFETLRSYSGRVFRQDDHFDRLFNSAAQLGMKLTVTRPQLAAGIDKLLQANELTDARLRLTVTPGDVRLALRQDQPPPTTVLITADKMPANAGQPHRYGVMVLIAAARIAAEDPLAAHKSTACFGRLIALQQAQVRQASEALLFTTTNRLSGGCLSNVFLVRHGKLLTPALDTPAFAGVTRRVVIELAASAGLEVHQGELTIRDVLDAEEVFLAGTVMELTPVSRVEKHIVANDEPGPVYRELHERYQAAAGAEKGAP